MPVSTRSSRGRRIKKVNYAEFNVSGTTSQTASSSDEDDEDVPIATVQPMQLKKKRLQKSKKKKTTTTSATTTKTNTKKKKKRKIPKKRRRSPTPEPSDDEDESESDDDDLIVLNPTTSLSSRKRKKPSSPVAPPIPPKKRRLTKKSVIPLSDSESDDDADEEDELLVLPKKRTTTTGGPPAKKKKKRTKKPPPEKRSARYRSSCPIKTRERISRARNQRLYMIKATIVNPLCRSYAVLGSTGNVYDIVIGHSPQCSCPDFGKGNLCKHILFVMLKVLRVPSASPHVYQRGLLSTELEEIFGNAPATLIGSNVVANQAVLQTYANATGEDVEMEKAKEVERKDLADNDCPICMEEFEADEKDELVWCQAQCGQNIHAQCFDMWANNARGKGDEVTCVYCRAVWKDNAGRKKKVPQRPANRLNFNEGYMNFGNQQGMSTNRDTSSYHNGWGNRYRGRYGYRRGWW